jgi:peroxiredoxin
MVNVQAQTKKISGTVYGITSGTTKVYFHGYRGNESYKIDSSVIDKTGKFVFTHLKNLQPGLYLLKVLDYKADFVINKKDSNIIITTSTEELPYQQVEIKNSREHDAFMQLKTAFVYYNMYKDSIIEVIHHLEKPEAAEKQLVKYELNYNKTLRQIKTTFPATHTADVLIPLFLIPLKEENAQHNVEYADDMSFGFHHFFDHVNFKDAALLNSPFYADKISEYLGNYMPDDMEGIQEGIDMLVEKTKNQLQIKDWTVNYLIEEAVQMGNYDMAEYVVQKHFSEGCEKIIDKDMGAMVQYIKNLKTGNPAPDISLPNNKMQQVKLSDVKGKRAVLVFFWASDCDFCKEIFTDVIAYYDMYKAQGYEIYAVSLDTDANDWNHQVNKYQLQWVNVIDLKGWKSTAAIQYNVTATPSFCLLDGNMKIIARTDYIENIEKLLDEMFK